MKTQVLDLEALVTQGEYKDSKLEISLPATEGVVIGHNAKIILDGVDISHNVMECLIRICPREIVTVDLKLVSIVEPKEVKQ